MERQHADQHLAGDHQQHHKNALAELRHCQKRRRTRRSQSCQRPFSLIIRRRRILDHRKQYAAEHEDHGQQQPAHEA